MRKLMLLSAAALIGGLVMARAASAASPCCSPSTDSSGKVHPGCGQLSPTAPPSPPTLPGGALVVGCIEVSNDTCAGGALLDTRGGESELIDGCLCVGGNCIIGTAGGPAQGTAAACAAAASRECDDTDQDLALPSPPAP